ncbi:MAG: hypothetical protein WDN75_07885 [Bacteroidota bacterium]
MTFRCLFLIVSVLFTISSHAQSRPPLDSLFDANMATFKGTTEFSGKGWDLLTQKARRTNYVLVGEDHFISEVPPFTEALAQNLVIDNYIAEIDQWMLDIFKDKITTLKDAQLNQWITANYNGFSFFQKKNEFGLLNQLIKQKVKLIGVEQVGLVSTTILFQYLVEKGSAKNKKAYELMRDSSEVVNNRFFSDMSKPFFMITPFFETSIAKLDKLSMKADEAQLIDALARSADIYKTGSHHNRIKLMQSNLMMNYPQLKGKKNLFKFGANHMIKGESYIPVYDLGTTAHVLAQSENQDSYHILVLPKAGIQAGFLKGSNPLSMDEEPYNSLKTFLSKMLR